MIISTYDIVGTNGVAVILITCALLQTGRNRGNDLAFSILK